MWHHSKRWPLAELRLPWQEGEALVKHKGKEHRDEEGRGLL